MRYNDLLIFFISRHGYPSLLYEPTLRHIDLPAMLAVKRSEGVTHKVHLRNSLHAGNKAHKQGIHPGFETREDNTRSPEYGYQWSHKKITCLPNFFFEKEAWVILRH